MGKTGYSSCLEICKAILKKDVDYLSHTELVMEIRKKIGVDSRTIYKYLYLLTDFGFIKHIENGIYSLDKVKIRNELIENELL